MNRHARLLKLLSERFPGSKIDLADNSAEHAGHKHGFDGETHYSVRIHAAEFAGKNRLEMHRLIMGAVKNEMDAGLHSFVIEECGP